MKLDHYPKTRPVEFPPRVERPDQNHIHGDICHALLRSGSNDKTIEAEDASPFGTGKHHRERVLQRQYPELGSQWRIRGRGAGIPLSNHFH